MRKLILKMSMSLDGFVGGPNGEIDWLLKSTGHEGAAWTVNEISKAGVHIMGSRTYHDMAAYWPHSTEVFAKPMNEIPKVIFTRQKTLTPASRDATTGALKDAERLNAATLHPPSDDLAEKYGWAHPRIANGPLAEEIARLKAEPGNDIVAHGGASFARALVSAGLVDEFKLVVHPVALGAGLALFSDLKTPLDLKLVEVKSFPSGAAAHVYQAG